MKQSLHTPSWRAWHPVSLSFSTACRVCRSLGMVAPTAVQRGCIPAILAGRDVLGTAHTGSGKTAAFALPILQELAADPFGVFALVLTPTRPVGKFLKPFFHSCGRKVAHLLNALHSGVSALCAHATHISLQYQLLLSLRLKDCPSAR